MTIKAKNRPLFEAAHRILRQFKARAAVSRDDIAELKSKALSDEPRLRIHQLALSIIMRKMVQGDSPGKNLG
jgi:hypothetical protein